MSSSDEIYEPHTNEGRFVATYKQLHEQTQLVSEGESTLSGSHYGDFATRQQALKTLARKVFEALTDEDTVNRMMGTVDNIPYDEFMSYNVLLLVVGMWYHNNKPKTFKIWMDKVIENVRKVENLGEVVLTEQDIIRYIHITDPTNIYSFASKGPIREGPPYEETSSSSQPSSSSSSPALPSSAYKPPSKRPSVASRRAQ